MPVDSLTPEQESKYGCFCDTPTSEQLAKYFLLDDTDKELIWNRRGEHNQLGFVVQLGTVRFLGTFLSDPTDVPQSVITYMANRLHVDAKSFSHYGCFCPSPRKGGIRKKQAFLLRELAFF